MANAKKYTLVRKGSVSGYKQSKKDETYLHRKGDVISKAEYDELSDWHKDQFEPGEVEVFASAPETEQQQSTEELKARIEELEATVKKAGLEEEVEGLSKDKDEPSDDQESSDGKKKKK